MEEEEVVVVVEKQKRRKRVTRVSIAGECRTPTTMAGGRGGGRLEELA